MTEIISNLTENQYLLTTKTIDNFWLSKSEIMEFLMKEQGIPRSKHKLKSMIKLCNWIYSVNQRYRAGLTEKDKWEIFERIKKQQELQEKLLDFLEHRLLNKNWRKFRFCCQQSWGIRNLVKGEFPKIFSSPLLISPLIRLKLILETSKSDCGYCKLLVKVLDEVVNKRKKGWEI